MQSSNLSLVKGYYKRINKQPPWYKFTVFLKRRNKIHSQISEENKYERKVTALWFSFQYNWLDWRKLHWSLLVTAYYSQLGNVILYSWHDFDWYDFMVTVLPVFHKPIDELNAGHVRKWTVNLRVRRWINDILFFLRKLVNSIFLKKKARSIQSIQITASFGSDS